MSYTEMYAAEPDGDMVLVKEFRNAWRGGMFIWNAMARRYLGLDRAPIVHPGEAQGLWDLAGEERVPIKHRIVLASTFDRVMVRRENFGRLADLYDAFAREIPDGEKSSLPEQAAALRELLEGDWRAVAWNQTSVNADVLWVPWDAEADQSAEYNIDRDADHWWLFDGVSERETANSAGHGG